MWRRSINQATLRAWESESASGADQDRFAVLAVSDPIITPADNLQQFKNQVNLEGNKPTAEAKSQRWCVLVDPL